MSWLRRLLNRSDVVEHEQDERALRDLHTAFDRVQARTERLEKELRRVNDSLRQRNQAGQH